MFNHEDTVKGVRDFYNILTSLVYPDENTLKHPPPTGWPNLNITKLRELGKNDTVIRLLQHLPYLSPANPGDKLLIHYETFAIDYTNEQDWGWDEIYPIPSHCVYLTRSVDGVGHNLILDTERGTITEYTIQEFHMDRSYSIQDYNAMPESDRWRAHRTSPVETFFAGWGARYQNVVWMLVPATFYGPASGRFYTRAISSGADEELASQGLQDWQPSHDDDSPDWVWRDLMHAKRLYDTFRRHGWPDSLDKDACLAELLEIERRKDKEDRAMLDALCENE